MSGKVKSFSKAKVCRICLCTDRKLYLIKKYNLFMYFEQVIKIDARAGDRLPQRVCWECGARLAAAAAFRNKAIHSDVLLRHILEPLYEKVPEISAIDREENNLTSNLTEKIFEVDHADYHFIYAEPQENILQDSEEVQEIKLGNLEIESDSQFDYIDPSHEIDETKEFGKVTKVRKVKVKKVDKRFKPANEVLNNDIFNITDLSYNQQIYEINKRQNSANYKNSEYKCSECFKGFQDQDAYKGHMNRHTDQCGIYQCDICKIRFKKLQALRNHATCHMQKFNCKKCTYVTVRRHAAKLHEEYHNGTKYVCPHCLENFDKISTYMSHIRIKHPSDIVCQLCGYSFISDKGLALHQKIKHRLDDHTVPEDGPFCTKCDIQFINKAALDRHIQLSTRHRDETETSKSRLRRPRLFQQRNSSIHSASEGKKKRNSCNQEGPMSCEQCEMQLPDPLAYYRHFRRMHPDKNRTKYPSKSKSMCEVCGKMFQSLALLQDHGWTHTDSKHFKCTQCDKFFQRKYRLIAHQRVHEHARLHSCAQCGKSFTTASNMNRHMVSHTGLKPFKCEMCGKCFKHASEKRVHITYVHLKKPWPKRARGKRKDSRQNQIPELAPMPADIVQPLWPACSDHKMDTLVQDKPMYYNIKI